MTGISPIYVGQTLFIHIKNYEVKEYQVIKVGRKYFYVNNYRQDYPISKETLRYEDKNYSQHNKQFYLSKQEILDKVEKEILISKFKKHFSGYDWNIPAKDSTLNQLRSAASCLLISHDAPIVYMCEDISGTGNIKCHIVENKS